MFSFFTPLHGAWWRLLPFQAMVTHPRDPQAACFFLQVVEIWRPWVFSWASQVAQVVKNLPASTGDAGDAGLIPGSGRSPGGGNDNLLQYSCLENSTDREAWRAIVFGVSKSRTWLSTHTHTHTHTHTPETYISKKNVSSLSIRPGLDWDRFLLLC